MSFISHEHEIRQFSRLCLIFTDEERMLPHLMKTNLVKSATMMLQRCHRKACHKFSNNDGA